MDCPRCNCRNGLRPSREIIQGLMLQVVSCTSCGMRVERPDPGTEYEERDEEVEVKKTCTEAGCSEEVLAKGLCKTHYWRKKSEERKAKKDAERKQPESRPEEVEQPPIQEQPPETEKEPIVSEEKEKTPPKKQKQSRTHSHEMTIRFFERDMDLLRDLTETAERERRYISAEVLLRLERLKRIEEAGHA